MPQAINWYPVVNTKGIIKRIVVHHGDDKYIIDSKEEMLGFLSGYGYVPNSFNRLGVDMLLNNKGKSKPSGLLHSMNGKLFEVNKASIRLVDRMHMRNGTINVYLDSHLFDEKGLRKHHEDFVVNLDVYNMLSLLMTGGVSIDLGKIKLTSTVMNRVKASI